MTSDSRCQRPPDDKPPDGALPRAGPVLDQVFDGDSLYALRAAVAAHGMQAGLTEGRLGNLVLAVHELAANAVRHGAGRGRLQVWNTGGVLRCQVTDDGVPRTTSPDDAAPAASDSARWNIEPGHGLWMIRQVADQTSLQGGSSGTVAEVSFMLGPTGQLPPFHLAQRLRDGCTVLSVTGQLDLGSARQFTRAVDETLAAAPAVRLILDLSGVTGWDSAGQAALITARQRVGAHPGARLIVVGLPGRLRQRLHDVGVADQLTLAQSVADALGVFARPALAAPAA